MDIRESIKSFFSGSKQTQIDRASKGTVRESLYSSIHGRPQTGKPSDQDLNVILSLYQKDPVVQAALTTRADAILSSGYTIEGKKTVKTQAETLLKKIGFDYRLLKQVVLNGLLYEHVFLEIERTNAGVPVALHVLETPYMTINYDEHGEILNFVEQGETGKPITFSTDDVVYMKFNEVSTSVWGEVGIKSLFRTLTTKNQIEKFLNHLAESNAWRQVMKTKMTDDNIKEFLPYFYSQSQDPSEMLILQVAGNGGDDVDKDTRFSLLRDPSDLKEFQGTLDYLRTQSLMYLKVPPIMIGLPDSSNRSNSDMQFKAFNIANESFRRVFTSFIVELFDKLGITTADFSWNPIDERSEKDDMEIAERLINMGAKPDMVEQFLRDTGLELPEGKLFEEKQEITESKSMDMYPSRQGKAEGESNDKIGTGADGTTREDQL